MFRRWFRRPLPPVLVLGLSCRRACLRRPRRWGLVAWRFVLCRQVSADPGCRRRKQQGIVLALPQGWTCVDGSRRSGGRGRANVSTVPLLCTVGAEANQLRGLFQQGAGGIDYDAEHKQRRDDGNNERDCPDGVLSVCAEPQARNDRGGSG